MYLTLIMIVNTNKYVNSPHRYSLYRDFDPVIVNTIDNHLLYGKRVWDWALNTPVGSQKHKAW